MWFVSKGVGWGGGWSNDIGGWENMLFMSFRDVDGTFILYWVRIFWNNKNICFYIDRYFFWKVKKYDSCKNILFKFKYLNNS